ncbi:MAG: pilus assembly protein PilM [Planctomycetota bacterium]
MLGMNGKKICPIGVDLGSGYLRMVQLGKNDQGLFLQSAAVRQKPDDVEFRAPSWQRWTIESIREIMQEEDFKGKSVVTALPSDDLFIDPIKISRSSLDRINDIIPQKLQKRLPFPVDNALFQHVVIGNGEQNGSDAIDVLTISTNRESVNRHLAIYEKTGLSVTGISIWPVAMAKSFVTFFCRRQSEIDTVSILINVGTNHTNIVITQGTSLLFARVVSIGYTQLEQGQMVQRLFSEIDACVRYFEDSSAAIQIGRIVFLAGNGTSRSLCDKLTGLAQKMQVPAQMGDVISAIEINHGPECLVDRRNCKVDWATAFGLSLEDLN